MKHSILLETFCIFLGISVIEASSPLNGFIFTSARAMVIGIDNALHFRRIGNLDAGELEVQVSCRENYDFDNEIIANKTFEIPRGEYDVSLHLPVNEIGSCFRGGLLKIKGAFGKDIISGNDSVSFTYQRKLFIIQTDKHLYKPGETVKFRLLNVDKDFRPYQDNNEADVHVKDATSTELFQFLDIDLTQGIAQYEFHLPDEPVEGVWEITASSYYGSASATFEVKKYVLPKIDLKIIWSPYVLQTDKFIPIKICANYTYGGPVEGVLHLNVSFEKKFYVSDDNPPKLEKSVQINGCYDYSINLSLIEPHSEYTDRKIKVVANVIESGTGEEKVAIQYIERSTPVKLKFSKEQRQFYRAGLPFNGTLQVLKPDDTPATGEEIEICTKLTKERIMDDYYSTKTLAQCKNYTSNEKGNIHFTVLADNIDVISINIIAKSIKYVANKSSGKQNGKEHPQAEAHLFPLFSPSESFIQILPVQFPVPCGTRQRFKVLFTAKENEVFKFYYQITRQNELFKVGTVEKYFYAQDDVSSIYENDKRLLNSNTTLIRPSLNEFERLITQKTRPVDMRNRYLLPIGEINIDIDVDENFSPEFYLLVYYVRDDRETVADSYRIGVEKCFKNKVHFTFGDKVQRPSQSTSVQITASPNSLCGIKTIEKSVTLLDSNDEFTKDSIFQAIHHLYAKEYCANVYCGDYRVQPGLADSSYKKIITSDEPYYSSYVDTFTSFQTSGVLVISDFFLITRPCTAVREDIKTNIPYGGFCANGIGNTIEGIDATMSVEEVRDYFHETWLFELELTGPDGTFVTKKQLPDNITEWIGSAVCINSKDGLGISDTASITAAI